jgi:hypothetical protein
MKQKSPKPPFVKGGDKERDIRMGTRIHNMITKYFFLLSPLEKTCKVKRHGNSFPSPSLFVKGDNEREINSSQMIRQCL